jgi:hypothetical protein
MSATVTQVQTNGTNETHKSVKGRAARRRAKAKGKKLVNGVTVSLIGINYISDVQ